MSNSSLITYTRISPNRTIPRNHAIDTISIHCMAGNLSLETCGSMFAKESNEYSSNYGIDSQGNIGLYVPESDRSWCTSNRANDHRAITIEVANDGGAETGWHVSDKAYSALIELLVDICQRNGIKQLLWQADKNLIGQVDKQNMTVHRWFANKACPGDYLYSHHGDIAKQVNEKLNGTAQATQQEDDDMDITRFKELMKEYRAELQDNDAGSWSEEARQWAVNNGIVVGNSTGEFNGMWQDTLSREQMVTILYRFAQMIGKA